MSVLKSYLPPVFCWLKFGTPALNQVRHFPRGGRGRSFQFLPDDEIVTKKQPVTQQDQDDADEFFREHSRPGSLAKTVAEEYERHEKFVAYKTIQRKYFKPPPDPNLLTWDAKEQMRFLNQEFPDEWTVDRLAESFPTDIKGVIRILKSTYKPKTLKELQKHDQRVRKRWLLLKEGKDIQGPITLRYEDFAKNSKSALLANANGIKQLPKPKISLFPEKTQHKEGTFEAMVKDYVKKKKSEQEASRLQAEEEQPNNEQLLQSVVQSVSHKNSKGNTRIQLSETFPLVKDKRR